MQHYRFWYMDGTRSRWLKVPDESERVRISRLAMECSAGRPQSDGGGRTIRQVDVQ
jgi:hypothetical protein